MYRRRTPGAKRDPVRRWALPDRVFFACGACHVLAHAFLEAYPRAGFVPLWFRPTAGFTGNHIVLARDGLAFDYHGYSRLRSLVEHTTRRARQRWTGWQADLIELPPAALVSEARSREFPGLWLREPGQFLHDALPRARRYLRRFPSPPGR